MKVTVIPITIGELGTITKTLVRELEEFEIGEQTNRDNPNYSINMISQNTKSSE